MRVHVSAFNGAQWFGVDYLNPYFENFEGGLGSLTIFGQKNPVYRLGGGAGVGFTYQFNEALALTAGYLAGEPSNPGLGAGLFETAESDPRPSRSAARKRPPRPAEVADAQGE